VANGNQLTGSASYGSTSGGVNKGTINSGVVGKKNDVDFVEGEIYWYTSRHTTHFHLDRADEHLFGPLDKEREFPWGTGIRINFKKAN
jgi:hypothetical protein